MSASEARSRVQGIFHPVITVSDMEASVKFYRDILGLRQTFDDMHDPAAISRLFGFDEPVVRSIVLECEDRSEFELIEYHRPRGRPQTDREMNDAGISALALRVTGLPELVRRVKEGGFAILSGIVEQALPDGAILHVAVCLGPDNVKTILVEPPPDRRSLGS